jgi:Zn finger protein HypA/HybF involved in hydrogenase expression
MAEEEKEKLVKCKNCSYELRKNVRRCPYCGILNPTVTTKEVMVTTIVIIIVMYIISFFIH